MKNLIKFRGFLVFKKYKKYVYMKLIFQTNQNQITLHSFIVFQ